MVKVAEILLHNRTDRQRYDFLTRNKTCLLVAEACGSYEETSKCFNLKELCFHTLLIL